MGIKKESIQVLHIVPNDEGYSVVNLIANRVSRKNGLALIESDGEELMTGGIIIEDNELNRSVLDGMCKTKQYEFVRSIKVAPFVKLYSDE